MVMRAWLLSGGAVTALLLAAGSALAQAQPPGQPPAQTVQATPSEVQEVVVTARLNAARDSIQPQVGASTYAFSQQQAGRSQG